MKAFFVVFHCILAIVLSTATRGASAATIVVGYGKYPSAKIAGCAEDKVNWSDADTADDTVCTESFAALELQRYLRKATGRADDFSIVKDDTALPAGDLILIGGPATNAISLRLAASLGVTAEQLAELGPEGYRLKSAEIEGRRVWLIAGGGRVGTLYGIYDFLHRLGCRWFAPEKIHEEVPSIEQLPPIDATERPSFISRGFLAWENRGTPELLLWMARNRLNYWCVEQKEHALMRKLGIRMVGGMHDDEERFLNPAGPYPYDHARFQGDENLPKDPYPLSTEYQGDADKDGKLSRFEAHPEWYAWDGKKRIPGIRGFGGTNFCTSNRDATAEFLKNYVQSLIDGVYHDADIVRFWTLDGAKWCHCSECKKLGEPTDRNLLLVHRLDREIMKARAAGKINRPIQIFFLAYADVIEPPTRPLPPDFDYNVCAATFYPIRRCFLHNFDDPACPVNRDFQRQLRGWASDPGRHYRGGLAIGEYYNVSVFKGLPICFMRTMANDIPYYYKTGARHFDYMHVTASDWGTKSLTNYQMARQLWDVHADCEALWVDYFSRRYGEAVPTMRSFYTELEKMLSSATELKYWLGPELEKGTIEYRPDERLCSQRKRSGKACEGMTLNEIVAHGKRCRELLDGARRAELPPQIAQRIAEDERTFTYGERTAAYYYECVLAFQLVREGRRDKARRHYAEACRIAELLRGDKMSAGTSSMHANAKNALDATRAAKALDHLAKLLESK